MPAFGDWPISNGIKRYNYWFKGAESSVSMGNLYRHNDQDAINAMLDLADKFRDTWVKRIDLMLNGELIERIHVND